MSDLQSSSEYRAIGILSPNARRKELVRIISELRFPEESGKPVSREEREAANDLCFRLFSKVVAGQMADDLGVTTLQVRRALSRAIEWTPAE